MPLCLLSLAALGVHRSATWHGEHELQEQQQRRQQQLYKKGCFMPGKKQGRPYLTE